MAKIVKTVKIVSSPFTSNLEVIAGFVMKIHMPYSDSMVTVKINPNITHYEDKPKATDPRINIRQAAVYQDTEKTQTLIFDFKDNNIQKIVMENRSFEIKLLNIGRKNMQGQDFPEFEFLVTEE